MYVYQNYNLKVFFKLLNTGWLLMANSSPNLVSFNINVASKTNVVLINNIAVRIKHILRIGINQTVTKL